MSTSFLGDATLGVGDESESHCPPSNIDVRVVVLAFRVLGDAAHRIDAGQEASEFDRAAQGAVGTLPSVQIGQCGVYLLIR